MNYLEQFTGGEANKIVVGLSYLNSNIAYTTAMNELDERYGNPDVVAHSFVKKALSWRNIKPNDAKGLDEYAIFLVECYNAVQSIESMKILEYSENMKQLVMKLPYYLHDRWRNLVCQVKERGETVVFQHIVDFVRREARKMNDPVYGRDVMSIDKWQEKKASKSSDGRKFMLVASTTGSTNAQDLKNSETKLPSCAHKSRTTKVSETKGSYPTYRNNPRQDAYKQPCTYCDQSHPMMSCTKFSMLTFREKSDFVMKLGLCYGCLRAGHQKADCRHKAVCEQCPGRHHTILHYNSDFRGDQSRDTANHAPEHVAVCTTKKALGAYVLTRHANQL
jgi:hypothetical protein